MRAVPGRRRRAVGDGEADAERAGRAGGEVEGCRSADDRSRWPQRRRAPAPTRARSRPRCRSRAGVTSTVSPASIVSRTAKDCTRQCGLRRDPHEQRLRRGLAGGVRDGHAQLDQLLAPLPLSFGRRRCAGRPRRRPASRRPCRPPDEFCTDSSRSGSPSGSTQPGSTGTVTVPPRATSGVGHGHQASLHAAPLRRGIAVVGTVRVTVVGGEQQPALGGAVGDGVREGRSCPSRPGATAHGEPLGVVGDRHRAEGRVQPASPMPGRC